MQFFEPENWFEVREALVDAGRTGPIGTGCDALIGLNPPKEAIEVRSKRASIAARSHHYHSVANPAAGAEPGERPTPPRVPNRGCRPGRTTQTRRPGKR